MWFKLENQAPKYSELCCELPNIRDVKTEKKEDTFKEV